MTDAGDAPAAGEPEDDGAPPALRRALQPGERLLWHGRPGALGLAWSRLPLLLFVPLWLGVAGLVMHGADTVGRLGQGGGVLAALAGGAVIALGLLLVGLVPLALLQARWIAYGVTDRRALIVDGTPWLGGVRSVLPEAIGGVERRHFPFGLGDLHFLREAPRAPRRRRPARQGFLAIPDAGRAEAAILRLAALPGRP